MNQLCYSNLIATTNICGFDFKSILSRQPLSLFALKIGPVQSFRNANVSFGGQIDCQS
eukprot:UN23952